MGTVVDVRTLKHAHPGSLTKVLLSQRDELEVPGQVCNDQLFLYVCLQHVFELQDFCTFAFCIFDFGFHFGSSASAVFGQSSFSFDPPLRRLRALTSWTLGLSYIVPTSSLGVSFCVFVYANSLERSTF